MDKKQVTNSYLKKSEENYKLYEFLTKQSESESFIEWQAVSIFYSSLSTKGVNAETGQQITEINDPPYEIIDGISCIKTSNDRYVQYSTNIDCTQSFTMSVWCYPLSATQSSTISFYGVGTQDSPWRVILFSQRYLKYGFERASGQVYYDAYLIQNKWNFCLMTVENQSIVTMYLNGQQVGSGSYSFDLRSAGTKVTVGNWINGGYAFEGYFANARIYNRILSKKEIIQLSKEIKEIVIL